MEHAELPIAKSVEKQIDWSENGYKQTGNITKTLGGAFGKDEVTSSNLVSSSKNPLKSVDFGGFCFAFGTFWAGLFLQFLFDPHADPQ